MPNFNKDAVRHGNEVVERGAGNGNFRPFLPSIYWKHADDEQFILILNPLDDVIRLDYHPFVETDDGFRSIIARTDPAIGEPTDPISDQWGYKPRTFDLMIAVKLEPIYQEKEVNGRVRQSVVGFGVATREIERRIRDEDGEITDDKEEVVIPEVGYIAQSPFMFGNQLNSYEYSDNPIHVTPFKVTKVGEGSGTNYRFDGYPDVPFDLINLIEFIENISYVRDPDELLALIEDLDQEQAGIAIGQYLLNLKLEELSDRDYYDEIFNAITKPSRYGNKSSTKTGNTSRPKKQSQHATSSVSKDKPQRSDRKAQPSAKEKLEALRADKARRDAEKIAA